MFLHIKKIKYLEKYRVQVTFNNGKKGIADLSPILKKGGVFKHLKKQSEFAKFRLDKELRIFWDFAQKMRPLRGS